MRQAFFGSRRVFVDTSAYFALTDPRDSDHQEARRVMNRLTDERWRLFTTNFILAETHALLLARLSRRIAARVLAALDQSEATTIVRVAARDERRARAIIEQYDDKDFSLTDATSFAVMERLHVTQAFTFDQNFRQYGFAIVGGDRR
jgi:predicted nucleic acid-binding protein